MAITFVSATVDASGTLLTTVWDGVDDGFTFGPSSPDPDPVAILSGVSGSLSGPAQTVTPSPGVGQANVRWTIDPPVFKGEVPLFTIAVGQMRDAVAAESPAVTNSAVTNNSLVEPLDFTYASLAALTSRFDSRLISELASDSNTAASGLGDNARVIASLEDASSRIDDALRRSERYTAAQLEQLQTEGNRTLRRMASALALGYLYTARGKGVPEGHQRIIDDAEDDLRRLQRGDIIIDIGDHAPAGNPSIDRIMAVHRVGQNRMSDRALFPIDDGRVDPS